MTSLSRPRCAAGLLLLLLVCAGCGGGDSRPRVRGKVTFGGEPVANQTLTLYSEGAPGEFSAQKIPLQPDGTFSGEVPARGTSKVTIEESLAVQEGQKPADKGRSIPAKYRSPATSELSWTIGDGDNYKEFPLKE